MSTLSRRHFMKLTGAGGLGAILCSGCAPFVRRARKPNVLWVVWDTARRDGFSLYGNPNKTTPFVDTWCASARVFDNCLSVANCTVPSHASMFTGLMPSEHGRTNQEHFLDDSAVTIADLLSEAGYGTYLYSANPHISRDRNFSQGFDLAEHPWDPHRKAAAIAYVKNRLSADDRSCELPQQILKDHVSNWWIKTSGGLAKDAVHSWLAESRGKPSFMFLNYMEAHRPYVPPLKYRQRFMSDAEVKQSYKVDRSWEAMWRYTFGVTDYTDEEVRLTRLTYDACIAELDEMFGEFLQMIEEVPGMEDTVVVLTSDHGEMLGEHHMLDHQYALYAPLLRVPLIVHSPERFAPGRDGSPAMNIDLFSSLLNTAGIRAPKRPHSLHLLHPDHDRLRVSECPSFPARPLKNVKKQYPEFDGTPWQRTLRSLNDGRHKFIRASDNKDELYDLTADPQEEHDLAAVQQDIASRMRGEHDRWISGIQSMESADNPAKPLSDGEKQRLESLGYVGSSDEK